MDQVRIDGERLVQAVVGVLRYLPPALWLDPLRELIQQHNPAVTVDLGGSGIPNVRLWPLFEVPLRWLGGMGRIPTRRGGDVPLRQVAPEAAIETERWLLFLNCTTSEEADAETVFQDYAIARRHAGDKDFLVLHVNAAWTRRIMAGVAMISPVGNERDVSPHDSLARYVAMRHLRLGSGNHTTEQEVEKHLAWLSWQSIYRLLGRVELETAKLLKGTPPIVADALRRLRDDAMELLERGDLAPTDHGLVPHLARLNIDPKAIPELPHLAHEKKAKAAAGVPLPPPKRPGAPAGAAAPTRGRPMPPPQRQAPPPTAPGSSRPVGQPPRAAAPRTAPPAPAPPTAAPRPAPRPAPLSNPVPLPWQVAGVAPPRDLPPLEPDEAEPPPMGPPAAGPPVTTRRRSRIHRHESTPADELAKEEATGQGDNGEHAESAPAAPDEPEVAPEPASDEDEGWHDPTDLGPPPHLTPAKVEAAPPAPTSIAPAGWTPTVLEHRAFPQPGDDEAVAGRLPGVRPRPARAAALLAAGLGVGGPRDDWKGVRGFLLQAKIDPDLVPDGFGRGVTWRSYDDEHE